jgi:hypothetical protein
MVTVELHNGVDKMGLVHLDDAGHFLDAHAYDPRWEENLRRLESIALRGADLVKIFRQREHRALPGGDGFHGRLSEGQWPPGSEVRR